MTKKTKDVRNIVATVSGGRSSVRVIEYLENSEKYKDFQKVYVFNNTGQEREKTFEFMQNAEKYWGVKIYKIEGIYNRSFEEGVGYKIVDNWEDLDMKSKVFSDMIHYKNQGEFDGLPNPATPYCSEMLKTRPCKKFGNDVFGKGNFLTSIGFRREDMPKRITWKEIEEDKGKFIYPLITDFENPVDNFELNRFWDNQPFKLEIHNKYGNCRYCFKKDEPIIIENIRIDIEAGNMETIEFYKREQKKYNARFFRDNVTIEQLIERAKMPRIATLDLNSNSEEWKCVCNFR